MADRVKDTAKEEAEKLKQLTTDAAKSGAYIYPLKGIFYFISHKPLWKPMLSRLLPTLGLGTGVTIFMFLFTYLPQAAMLAFTSGPLAALTAMLLVASQSSTITMLLSKTLLIEDALIDTFDGTLVSRGHTALVGRERTVKGSSAGDVVARLGKLAAKPFQKFTPQAIVRYIMYLPLNFIPVVGTALFLLAQGRKHGPNAHSRYFHLKGMNQGQKEEWLERRQGAYTSFGVPAVLLETIPIAGIFFAFTNTCGAALWAADMEQNESTAPGLQQQAKKAE
ncbi:hypothetical protein MBLNU230_g6752t1 [Neophaeotheca triangularis]